jgi:hypothetical protein
MAIEILDFPINSMVIFHSYVKLPEGNLLEGMSNSSYEKQHPTGPSAPTAPPLLAVAASLAEPLWPRRSFSRPDDLTTG